VRIPNTHDFTFGGFSATGSAQSSAGRQTHFRAFWVKNTHFMASNKKPLFIFIRQKDRHTRDGRETFQAETETRPRRDVSRGLRLETVSRPRRRDRDHIPETYMPIGCDFCAIFMFNGGLNPLPPNTPSAYATSTRNFMISSERPGHLE